MTVPSGYATVAGSWIGEEDRSVAVPHDQGSDGGTGARAWGPTGEGVVPHRTWRNHESLHRGGRLLRRESLPDGQKKEDIPG